MKKWALAFLSLAFISGCNIATIDNFDDFTPAPLERAEFMPSREEAYKKLPSVVIFDFSAFEDAALKSEAAKLTELALAEVILSSKMADLHNRKNMAHLREEVRLAEVSGKPYNGKKIVDYAIDGSISNVTFEGKYVEKESSEKDGGKKSGYNYTAIISGEIKIYEIPSLKIVGVLPFRGEASHEEGRRYQNLWRMRKLEGDAPFDQALLKEAIKSAFSANIEKMKSFFPRNGFIMEKRVSGEQAIFLVNLGSGDGVKSGDTLDIIETYMEINPLTKEKEIFSKIMTQGVIGNKVEEGRSWMLIKDKEEADKIRLGMPVKFSYKK